MTRDRASAARCRTTAQTLEKVAGIAIIAMGVLFLLALVVPLLNREWHVDALAQRAGNGGPLVAGAAFAIAWTPCVGPALASILGLAATQDSVAQGGGLLAVYSLGLAVPFLITAVAFNRRPPRSDGSAATTR